MAGFPPTEDNPVIKSPIVRIAIWSLFWTVVMEAILVLVISTVPPIRTYWEKHVGRLSNPQQDIWHTK